MQSQTPLRDAMSSQGQSSVIDPNFLPPDAQFPFQNRPSDAAPSKATPPQTRLVGEAGHYPVVFPKYEQPKGYKGKGAPRPPGTMPPLGGFGVPAPPKSAAVPGQGSMAADAPDVESARGSKRVRHPSSSGSGSETPRIPLSSDGAANRFIKLMRLRAIRDNAEKPANDMMCRFDVTEFIDKGYIIENGFSSQSDIISSMNRSELECLGMLMASHLVVELNPSKVPGEPEPPPDLYLRTHTNIIIRIAEHFAMLAQQDRLPKQTTPNRMFQRTEMSLYQKTIVFLREVDKIRADQKGIVVTDQREFLFSPKEFDAHHVRRRRQRGNMLIQDQKETQWLSDDHYQTLAGVVSDAGWNAFKLEKQRRFVEGCPESLKEYKERIHQGRFLIDSEDEGRLPLNRDPKVKVQVPDITSVDDSAKSEVCSFLRKMKLLSTDLSDPFAKAVSDYMDGDSWGPADSASILPKPAAPAASPSPPAATPAPVALPKAVPHRPPAPAVLLEQLPAIPPGPDSVKRRNGEDRSLLTEYEFLCETNVSRILIERAESNVENSARFHEAIAEPFEEGGGKEARMRFFRAVTSDTGMYPGGDRSKRVDPTVYMSHLRNDESKAEDKDVGADEVWFGDILMASAEEKGINSTRLPPGDMQRVVHDATDYVFWSDDVALLGDANVPDSDSMHPKSLDDPDLFGTYFEKGVHSVCYVTTEEISKIDFEAWNAEIDSKKFEGSNCNLPYPTMGDAGKLVIKTVDIPWGNDSSSFPLVVLFRIDSKQDIMMQSLREVGSIPWKNPFGTPSRLRVIHPSDGLAADSHLKRSVMAYTSIEVAYDVFRSQHETDTQGVVISIILAARVGGKGDGKTKGGGFNVYQGARMCTKGHASFVAGHIFVDSPMNLTHVPGNVMSLVSNISDSMSFSLGVSMRSSAYLPDYLKAMTAVYKGNPSDPCRDLVEELMKRNLQNMKHVSQNKRKRIVNMDYSPNAEFLRRPEKLILEGAAWMSKDDAYLDQLCKRLWHIFPNHSDFHMEFRQRMFRACTLLEMPQTKSGFPNNESYIRSESYHAGRASRFTGEYIRTPGANPVLPPHRYDVGYNFEKKLHDPDRMSGVTVKFPEFAKI